LDPVPAAEDIGVLYSTYYTHEIPKVVAYSRVVRFLFDNRTTMAANLEPGSSSFCGRAWRQLATIALPGGAREAEARSCYLGIASPGARLLDIGCGSGKSLERMRRLGWEVMGTEVDPAAAATARSRGLEVMVGDVLDLELPLAYFDAITVEHVLEHALDPMALVARLRLLIRPGGRLVVMTPNVKSLGHRLFGADWFWLDPPRHITLFSQRSIEQLLRDAGVYTVDVKTSPHGARDVWVYSREIRKTGRAVIPTAPGIGHHLRGAPFQLAERLKVRRDADAGEELVAIGTV